jgi:hypothetical protein
MKKKLAEMEAEAAALKRMQDKSSQEMGGNSQGRPVCLMLSSMLEVESSLVLDPASELCKTELPEERP